MTWNHLCGRLVAVGTGLVLVVGCGGEPAPPPISAPTASAELITACVKAAETQPRAQLTYAQAMSLAGQEVTACRISVPPATGKPEILHVPSGALDNPEIVEGIAMDRPRPQWCDTVAQSTVMFLVVAGELVEARQCGASSLAGK